MEITDRELFFKYALPCATTLVKRGVVTQDYVNQLIELVYKNKPIPKDTEEIFKVAMAMCNSIAAKMKKDSIDKEVIRRYFLVEHARIVDLRYKIKKDFDPVLCKTYKGEVIAVGKHDAVVETKLGKLKCRTDFTPYISVGDRVVVHNKFIVEKINEDIEKLMANE
jgi:hydrogenase maturation factor